MKQSFGSSVKNEERLGADASRPASQAVSRWRYRRFIFLLVILFVVWSVWLSTRRESPVSQPPAALSNPSGQDKPSDGQPPLPNGVLNDIKSLKAEALRVAESLVVRFPKDAQCYDLSAGVHYRLNGDAAKADELWKTATELDPKLLAPYFGRTNIAWSQGDFDMVIELMRGVLQQNPNSADAQNYLANALIESGRFEEALQSVKASQQTGKNSVASCLLLGKASMQLDDFAKAIEYYEDAVQQNPECWEAYYGLAQAHQHLGHTEKAQEYLAKFKSLRGERSAKDDRSAADRLISSDAALVHQEVLATYLAAGEICRRQGDFQTAEEYFLRAATIDPRDQRGRQALQRLYQQQQGFCTKKGTAPFQMWMSMAVNTTYRGPVPLLVQSDCSG